MIPKEVWDVICLCGRPATTTFYVSYKYPRAQYVPGAVDPENVQGGGHNFTTCGDPECEADAFLACRDEIIDHTVLHPLPWMPSGMSAEQVAGLVIYTSLSPGGNIRVIGDEAA